MAEVEVSSNYYKIAENLCMRIRRDKEYSKLDFFCIDNSEQEPGSLLDIIRTTAIDENKFKEAYKKNKKQTIYSNDNFMLTVMPKTDKTDKILAGSVLGMVGMSAGFLLGFIGMIPILLATYNSSAAAISLSIPTIAGGLIGSVKGLGIRYDRLGKFNYSKDILSYEGELNSENEKLSLPKKQLNKQDGIVQLEIKNNQRAYRFLNNVRDIYDVNAFIRNSWTSRINPTFNKRKVL